jgi:hypothetical protein
MGPKQKSLGPRAGLSYSERARARWNGRTPDWVIALAAEADRFQAEGKSQGDLGRALGLAGSIISAVIGKSYGGRYDMAEAKVRGALMNATVSCPVEGTIGRDRCAMNQALKFSAANPVRARFPFACRTCHNKIEAGQ